jgi:ABC-type sulfate/molybdate transport systems ATPase subunit
MSRLASTAMTARLSLRHISKPAPGPSGRLVDVSIDALPGERVALLGDDDEGKSMLLAIAVGLERPQSGDVLLDGEAVDRPGAERAIVSARAPLFPWMTARENIAYATAGRAGAREPLAWLALLRLEHTASALPRELERTDRHGIALARALAVEPRVLAVDEPAPAPDAVDASRWRRMLGLALDADVELTALVAIRDANELEGRATRTVELRDGRLLARPEACA